MAAILKNILDGNQVLNGTKSQFASLYNNKKALETGGYI